MNIITDRYGMYARLEVEICRTDAGDRKIQVFWPTEHSSPPSCRP